MTTYKSGNRINFGKHQGKIIDDVIKDDPQYIEWAIDTIEWFELNENLNKMLTEYLSFQHQDDYDDYSWADGYSSFRYGERD